MRRLLYLLLLVFLAGCQVPSETNQLSLAGAWQFQMDPEDRGLTERWYAQQLPETIQLPGSMNSNGKGFDVDLDTKWTGNIVDSSFFTDPRYAPYREADNIKIPFWLQPLKHYQGAAWYRREVQIPADWAEKTIELSLERPHWETIVWVDDREVGLQNSLATPHTYDLSTFLSPGAHVITIRVDNRMKEINVGANSHSVSDHTQSNWNGIVGSLQLKARPKVHIEDIRLFPKVNTKTVRVDLTLSIPEGQSFTGEILLRAANEGQGSLPPLSDPVILKGGGQAMVLDYPMGDRPLLWDEFHPNLYTMEIALQDEQGQTLESREVTFGMRSFIASEGQIRVNDRPVFLRGTLECAIFPKTGYPPTDTAEWLRIFRKIKEYGLNHMRFHSWCPPEAAFTAADREGVYLQVECSSWANQGTTLGDSLPVDQYIYDESERIVRAYGNHPSFCLLAYGNEPGGSNQQSFLGEFVNYWKDNDARRIYTSGAGWPLIPENEFHNAPNPRIQQWGAGLSSIINSEPPQTTFDFRAFIGQYEQPVVSHEIGQWCVYPNFAEIEKYDGPLRARNFEIFRDQLAKNGLGEWAEQFLLASGKLQTLCYKADIEAALRTPRMGGFQLLDLHDFPGQGTALVGVLDAFWEEKGYVTGEEYSRFCNSTVPLVRLPQRVFTRNQPLRATVEVAHFGSAPLLAETPQWEIRDQDGQVLFSGELAKTDISIGNGQLLGTIQQSLDEAPAPCQLTLAVRIAGFENDWDIWVYPQKPSPSEMEAVRVVQRLDATTAAYLKEGGKVLLSISQGALAADRGGDIPIGFSSIFWNTAWTRGQAPHSLGILCDPEHPALASFPTEYHSNWQWSDAMRHASAMLVGELSENIQPIVRVVDDWFTNRSLALVFEVKVGDGKLLITSIDLLKNAANRPEARQLLYSLQRYMTSESFQPSVTVTLADVETLFPQ